MVIFKIEHPVRNVRLAKVDIPDALIDRVGEHIAVEDEDIRRTVPIIAEAFHAVERKPERHALAVHLVRPGALRAGKQLADLPPEKALVCREVARFDRIAARKQRVAQQAVLHALAAAVNPFDCDDPGFFHLNMHLF